MISFLPCLYNCLKKIIMKYRFFIFLFAASIVTGCSTPDTPAADLYNQAATLASADTIFANLLHFGVITSSINRTHRTMSTLYGNPPAVSYARRHADGHYPPGAVLYLVSWHQRDDPHWFGAHIPDSVQRVEILTFDSPAAQPVYQVWEGSPLQPVRVQEDTERVARIRQLPAAVIPD